MNARIYGRFSSKPQERGDSKRRQIEGAKHYAANANPPLHIVSEPYFDEAVSGKAGANLEKEFGRLLKDAKAGEVILVEALDRIGRQNPFILGKLLYDTVQKGITVVAWHEGKSISKENIDNLDTQFSVFTGAAVGHADNATKMRRLLQTTQEAYRQGEKGIQTGTLVKYLPHCFIWDAVKNEIKVDEEKADVIRGIFKSFNAGVGRTTICKRLNEAAVPTMYGGKGTNRRGWIETSVTKVLKNESYAGVLNLKGRRFTCIPKIIRHEEFDKAQMLIKRYSKRCGNLRSRINNLFAGVGKCARCGAAVIVSVSLGKKKGNKTCYSYRCSNARLGTCSAKRMRNARIIELVFFTQYFGGSPSNLFQSDNKDVREQIAVLESKREQLAKAIDNLFDMVEAGDSEAKARIQQRRQSKVDVEKEIAVLRAGLTEQTELPTALERLDELLGTPEAGEHIKNFYPQLEKTLSDNETRRKLVNILPVIFTKVIFDLQGNTLEPIKKDGTSLPYVDMDTFEDYSKERKAA